MMKCKYCGGNLTLEQAYCPHCGRPNEEAAQHVKDMEHYKSNFEDTKSDVYEVAEKNTEIPCILGLPLKGCMRLRHKARGRDGNPHPT